MKYTYLLVNLLSVCVPLLFSFHSKLRFYKKWSALFPALLITAVFFIGWDIYFTHLKVWGFNPEYLTGIYLFNLPVEEILFFFCIPYSCMFTYCNLGSMIGKDVPTVNNGKVITLILMVISAIQVILFHQHRYTVFAFSMLAVLLFVAHYVVKVSWLLRFYRIYLILLLPFFLVNGILTGTGLAAPVVWYNPSEMLNIRLLTIPVEDIFYGMDLILFNILIFSGISAKIYNSQKARKKVVETYHFNNT